MKYSKGIVRVLFIVSGFLLFLLSYALQLNNYLLLADGVKDFGVVLLSVVVLDFIWNAVGGDFSREDKQASISKVYLSPVDVEKEVSWIELVKKARRRIDLQGLSLHYLATSQGFMEALRERIAAGVKVRVIMMSPASTFANDSRLFMYPENSKNQCQTSAGIFLALKDELKKAQGIIGKFKIVLSEEIPLSISLRRFDQKLFIIHYVATLNTLDTPAYFVEEKANPELFRKYLAPFENQFKRLNLPT